MELGQSRKIEWNMALLSLILANCPLFSLYSYTNSELVLIVTPSTQNYGMWIVTKYMSVIRLVHFIGVNPNGNNLGMHKVACTVSESDSWQPSSMNKITRHKSNLLG